MVGVDEQKDIAVLQLDEAALAADSKATSTVVRSLPVCDDTEPLQVVDIFFDLFVTLRHTMMMPYLLIVMLTL